MNSITQVTIYHGNSLISPDPDQKILREVAECEYAQFIPANNGQIRLQKKRYRVHKRNIDGQLAVPTGLIPAVVDRLRLRGHHVQIDDRREFRKAQVLSPGLWKACDAGDLARLLKIRDHPLGQIEVRHQDEAYDWITLILKNYPKAKTLIPVSSKRMAWFVFKAIRERAPNKNVRIKKRYWPSKPPHCLIVNYMSLGSFVAKDWDIVLLPDTRTVSHAKWLDGMLNFLKDPYRLYSFVPQQQVMSPYEALLLEAVSGPVIHAAGRPAVEVLWLSTPTSATATYDHRSLDWKRDVWWKNDRRNEYIAGVANAFVRRNLKKLRKLGVPFGNDEPNIPNWCDPAIEVVVESTEHGQELLKRLPEWSLRSQDGAGQQFTHEKRAAGTIVTTTRAAIEGIHADVVIQAAGGGGIGQFQKTVGIDAAKQEQASALIVEFTDKHCDLAAQDATRRSRLYRELGWQPIEKGS